MQHGGSSAGRLDSSSSDNYEILQVMACLLLLLRMSTSNKAAVADGVVEAISC